MVNRKVFICILIAAVLLVNINPIQAGSAFDIKTVNQLAARTNLDNLKAKAAILVDCNSGSVLFEKNSHERLPIASITKIMTMLLVMEALDNGKIKYEDKVPVSEHAFSMKGSTVFLNVGDEYPVKDMLKAVAVASANDAAVALAEFVGGSEQVFVSRMNDRAKELGMKDTNFLDCTGLTDEGHYSSAYDIAIMSRELINKHPEITEFTTLWHETFADGKTWLDNTNKLVRHYNGTIGLKTGYTKKAGECLSAVVRREGMTLISVVLGVNDSNTRFAETVKLMDHGFSNFESASFEKKDTPVGKVQVSKGMTSEISAVVKDDISFMVYKGSKDKIEKKVNLVPGIAAPVKKGQKLGEIIYSLEDKELARVDLVAGNSVPKATFVEIFVRMITEWFGMGRMRKVNT